MTEGKDGNVIWAGLLGDARSSCAKMTDVRRETKDEVLAGSRIARNVDGIGMIEGKWKQGGCCLLRDPKSRGEGSPVLGRW
jgi:hypothetical protein